MHSLVSSVACEPCDMLIPCRGTRPQPRILWRHPRRSRCCACTLLAPSADSQCLLMRACGPVRRAERQQTQCHDRVDSIPLVPFFGAVVSASHAPPQHSAPLFPRLLLAPPDPSPRPRIDASHSQSDTIEIHENMFNLNTSQQGELEDRRHVLASSDPPPSSRMASFRMLMISEPTCACELNLVAARPSEAVISTWARGRCIGGRIRL